MLVAATSRRVLAGLANRRDPSYRRRMTEKDEPYGLMFADALPAAELREGQIAVLDGHVIGVETDPDDPQRVRLTLVRVLGPPPGKAPDQRPIEVICPRDMVVGTAEPHNIEFAGPPIGS